MCADEELSLAAQRLRGLVDVLPELPDEVQGALAVRIPGLLELPPEEVRQRLEALSKALELEFGLTARLVGKVSSGAVCYVSMHTRTVVHFRVLPAFLRGCVSCTAAAVAVLQRQP